MNNELDIEIDLKTNDRIYISQISKNKSLNHYLRPDTCVKNQTINTLDI